MAIQYSAIKVQTKKLTALITVCFGSSMKTTNESSFETLLARSGNNSIHIKNLQKLMTEIYKSMNHLNPSIIWEFPVKNPIMYNLRIQNLCKLPTIKTLGFGLDSLSFLGSFLWNTLDDSIKQVPTLSRFKKRIKDWTADRSRGGGDLVVQGDVPVLKSRNLGSRILRFTTS